MRAVRVCISMKKYVTLLVLLHFCITLEGIKGQVFFQMFRVNFSGSHLHEICGKARRHSAVYVQNLEGRSRTEGGGGDDDDRGVSFRDRPPVKVLAA